MKDAPNSTRNHTVVRTDQLPAPAPEPGSVTPTHAFAEVFRRSPSFLAVLRGPEHVFETVNDAYLRAQGQDGVTSYGRMVDLLLAERRAR